MTVKELYDWARGRNAENMQIVAPRFECQESTEIDYVHVDYNESADGFVEIITRKY